MKSSMILLTLQLVVATVTAQQPTTSQPQSPASAQEQSSSTPVSILPNAPQSTSSPKPMQAYEGIVMGAFCGTGASYSATSTKPTVGCGAGIDLLFLPLFFEFGVMAPQASHSDISGYISFDFKVPIRPVSRKYLPVLIGGYSRLFETGHALDYGVALAIPRKSSDGEPRSLQIELRDYWTFASPNQHNVMLRVGWLIGASD